MPSTLISTDSVATTAVDSTSNLVDSTVSVVDSTANFVNSTVSTAMNALIKSDTTMTGQAVQFFKNMSGMTSEDIFGFLIKNILTIGLKVLIAIAIYFIGRRIVKYIVKLTKILLIKREVDVSLRSFVLSFVNISLTATIFMVIIGVLGIDTTSLVALFASAGLAVGMALSGTLQNFAGGILILFLKPFKVGDFIETQGQVGTVKSIQLFNMMINTPDNKTIIIPNGGVANNIINNYSKEDTRRVDWSFGIAYGDSYDKAKEILLTLCKEDKRILIGTDTTEPFIALGALADSSVNITVRVWVLTVDYWDVFFDMNEKVYKTFSEQGINIPFPQMDVHLIKE